jgi:hypothetical protein
MEIRVVVVVGAVVFPKVVSVKPNVVELNAEKEDMTAHHPGRHGSSRLGFIIFASYFFTIYPK